MPKTVTYSAGMTPKHVIKRRLPKVYTMELVGQDQAIVRDIVNQGIDSHLEAVMLESEARYNNIGKLCLRVTKDGMMCLIRRLWEHWEAIGDDNAYSLRSGILTTLEIEEI